MERPWVKISLADEIGGRRFLRLLLSHRNRDAAENELYDRSKQH